MLLLLQLLSKALCLTFLLSVITEIVSKFSFTDVTTLVRYQTQQEENMIQSEKIFKEGLYNPELHSQQIMTVIVLMAAKYFNCLIMYLSLLLF
jgi:hypothetical protein